MKTTVPVREIGVEASVGRLLRMFDTIAQDRRRQFLSDMLASGDGCDLDLDVLDDMLGQQDRAYAAWRATMERTVRDMLVREFS
jgi:hypothetical protein